MPNYLDRFEKTPDTGKCDWCHTVAKLEIEPQEIGFRRRLFHLCHECFVALCNVDDQKFADRCPDPERRFDFITWADKENRDLFKEQRNAPEE
jgi:hypothetical protein